MSAFKLAELFDPEGLSEQDLQALCAEICARGIGAMGMVVREPMPVGDPEYGFVISAGEYWLVPRKWGAK
jgi:hypothetical protein